MANVTKFLKSVSRIKQIKIIKLFKERYLKAMTNKNINIKYLIIICLIDINCNFKPFFSQNAQRQVLSPHVPLVCDL